MALRAFADGALFGSVTGTGTPRVLALPGWGHTQRDFDAVLAPAGEPPLNAIALDLPGFGASPPPPAAWGAHEYAAAVGAVLSAMQTPVVLFGHSFGGRVALHLAPLVPDRIERLVLTGVPLLDRQGRAARPAAAYRVGRRLHRLGLLGDERLEAMKAKYGSADYRAAQGVMRDVLVRILAEQYGDEMAAIGAPVDLVWGEHDTEAPLEAAERAKGLFPSARLLVLPGVGHLTPTEAPGQLRRVVVGGPVPEPGWR